jgi:micrococcal nuclease
MLKYYVKHFYYTRFLILIIIIISFFSIIPLAEAAERKTYLVTAVHDGDTVSIKAKSFIGIPLKIERIRLIGIDAPELKQEPWGRRAKRHLKKLISESNWVVNVEFDVEQRDKYGRLLCYLWDKNGRLINERMLEDGYAVLYTLPPNVKYAERFTAAQKKAQSKNAGIWGKGGIKKSPEEWRKEHLKNK